MSKTKMDFPMEKNTDRVKVLVLCLSDPASDPRPRRVIELCSSLGFDVSVMSYASRETSLGVTRYNLRAPSPNLLSKIVRRLWGTVSAILPFESWRMFCDKRRFELAGAKDLLEGKRFDLFIVEDLQLLPLVFEVRQGGKVLFDAREYYPRQNEGELWFDMFDSRRRVQLCSCYMTRCDAVITVSEGLRREYFDEFGISAGVYRGTPNHVDLPVHNTDPRCIRMVYHGAANRNRRIENLIDIVSLLDDRFSLDLILVGNPRYRQELRRKAADMKRINFIEPVGFEEIIPTIAKYDIGFFYCEPVTFNLANCLPNKFFEYIQARLMIAIGPSPDMAEIVHEYQCGIVAEEFSVHSMAKAFNALTADDIDEYKRNSDKAARELCFEKESGKLVSILKKLV